MLSRKFGREVTNYFSGSPLNRLSFLRTDHSFLRSAFSHPSARFLLLENSVPAVQPEKPPRLAFASIGDVEPLTGADPFARTEQEMLDGYDSTEERPTVLFLGVDDKGWVPATVPEGDAAFEYKSYMGSPYFAVDVTARGGPLAEKAKELGAATKAKGWSFMSNPRDMSLASGEGTSAGGRGGGGGGRAG